MPTPTMPKTGHEQGHSEEEKGSLGDHQLEAAHHAHGETNVKEVPPRFLRIFL
jgi:hypothetical protein